MAQRNAHFPSHDEAHAPPARGRAKISALVGLFAFVGVLATAAVAVMSRVQSTPVDTNAFMSMSFAANSAASAAGGDLPLAAEPDFNDRFAQEKRSARIEELPAQF